MSSSLQMCAPPLGEWDGSCGLDLGWAGPCLLGFVAFSASKTSESRSQSMLRMLCTKKFCYVLFSWTGGTPAR